jgi:hypothetical protein
MLTDTHISILRDIRQASSVDPEKRAHLVILLGRGYIERHGDICRITPLGEEILTCVGLNEA